MNRKHTIYIPSYSDYAHNVLKNLSATQRAALTDTELKHLKDDYAIRNFVHKATFDHLTNMLTKVGMIWDFRVYEEEEIADQLEVSAINQYQYPEKRNDVIKAQARENVYHMSCVDVMLSSHMLAQNIKTSVYEVSAGTKKATEATKGIAQIRLSHERQMQDGHEAVNTLNQLLLNQLNSMDWAQATLGLEQNDIRVLLSLFVKKDGAMTLPDIAKGAALSGKTAYLKKNVDKLIKAGMIFSEAKHGPKVKARKAIPVYYMISSKGVDKMMQYRNYLHKITFGA